MVVTEQIRLGAVVGERPNGYVRKLNYDRRWMAIGALPRITAPSALLCILLNID